MPESLLTVLKLFFLALLYLFFFRVLRAVWAELHGATAEPAPAAVAVAGTTGRAPRLRVVEPAARRGQTYDLGDELTVGRANGCQVALAEDTFVSQLHARIFRKGDQHFVEDLGSTNGTFLNRKKVGGPTALKRGDRLQVGSTVLEVTTK